jgi:hypothetical protein
MLLPPERRARVSRARHHVCPTTRPRPRVGVVWVGEEAPRLVGGTHGPGGSGARRHSVALRVASMPGQGSNGAGAGSRTRPPPEMSSRADSPRGACATVLDASCSDETARVEREMPHRNSRGICLAANGK